MTSYRYAVKVKPSRSGMLTVWRCEVCGESDSWVHLNTASSDAHMPTTPPEQVADLKRWLTRRGDADVLEMLGLAS